MRAVILDPPAWIHQMQLHLIADVTPLAPVLLIVAVPRPRDVLL